MKEQLKLLYRATKYRYISDKSELSHLLKKIRKGDTVFDVGAHKGAYTYWMQKAAGPNGKVFAFEPQQIGAVLLEKLFPSASVHRLALSDQPGVLNLYIQPQRFDVSFEASLQNRYDSPRVETVEVDTLDAFCAKHGLRPSFIKIDVEGNEERVIRGGLGILAEARPTLLVEAEERHTGKEQVQRLFDMLFSLGYCAYFFRQGIKTPLSDFNPGADQNPALLGTKKYINNFVFEG